MQAWRALTDYVCDSKNLAALSVSGAILTLDQDYEW